MVGNCLYPVFFLLTIFHVLLVRGQMPADAKGQCFSNSFTGELHLVLKVRHNDDDISVQFKDVNHTFIDCTTTTQVQGGVNITTMESVVNISASPPTPMSNTCGVTCTMTNCTWLFKMADNNNFNGTIRTHVDQDRSVTCSVSALDVAVGDFVMKNDSLVFQESVITAQNVQFALLDINGNEVTNVALGDKIFIQLTTMNPSYNETNGIWGSIFTNCFVSNTPQSSFVPGSNDNLLLTGSDGCAITGTAANLTSEFSVILNQGPPKHVATLGPISTFMVGSLPNLYYQCEVHRNCTGDFNDSSNAQCYEMCQASTRKRREAEEKSGYGSIRYVTTAYLKLVRPCQDVQGYTVHPNARYKLDNCKTCTCIDGSPQYCSTPQCAAPTCKDARPIEGECCKYQCPGRLSEIVIVGVSAVVGLVIIVTAVVGVCLVVGSRRRRRDKAISTEKKQIEARQQEDQFVNPYKKF